MDQQSSNPDSIFAAALELQSTKERSAFLDQACGNDAELRRRMDRLLRAYPEVAGSFLESPPPQLDETVHHPVSEAPGATIGPYVLREQIGEGGMGVVFVAEQESPVRRKVALKIIKPGMDTAEVIARFEAERQALALMDHPNIAKVHDAGTTDSGRPYFVMELVRGISITDYCDQHKLTVRHRLDLFIQVCHAIQHAHQKGVIHRDVKPTNVLVTLHDGEPVPKVIDFGVAKAMHQRLTERTIYTRFTQLIGTPMYMSPEQAELSGLDVDTRSDVYSLGVLLYELLTGVVPFDRRRFEKAAYDEIRRIVREEEPAKPSTKISTLGDTASSVSAHRGTDPRSLSKCIMGDLDIIVMKAMDKNRTRRYETANSLADDVQRFLASEPIVARPPSIAYRFAKFAGRNRIAMVTSLLIIASLLLGIAATWQMANVASEREREAKRLLAELAQAYYGEAVTAALAGDRERVKWAQELAKRAGMSPGPLRILDGLLALNSGDYGKAVSIANESLQDVEDPHGSNRIGALSLLVAAAAWDGDWASTERYLNKLPHWNARTKPTIFLGHMCTAHFHIGMMRLAERNRESAHEHFRKAVETKTIGAFDYEWAKAYLARMDEDEGWPRWPQK